MNFSETQQKAINTNGNVIVSAAAGAGKTSVLSERVFRLVSEGTPIDRMLILTFTRAAAGEMKSRILARIENAASASDDEKYVSYMRGQAQLCASANISTIHSFCSKVVYRHFYRVGLSPSAKTIDETESSVLQREIREKVLSTAAADSPELYRTLLGGFNGETALAESLQRLYAFLNAEPDPDAWLIRTEDSFEDPAVFESILDAELKYSQNDLLLSLSELRAARDLLPLECAKSISLLDEILMHGRGALLQKDRSDYAEALKSIPSSGNLSFAKDMEASVIKDIKEAKANTMKLIREQIAGYSRTAAELFQIQTEGSKLVHAFFSLLRAFRDAYSDEKRQRGVVDFDDLEHMTIEILRDDQIAAEYRERFHYVIVDEYQDSNRVQETILSRIRRKDNLFYVGDVKQSIYRFRKADPRLFLEKCRTFSGNTGTRIDLKENYRSSEAVISCVNRVFETVMREDIAGIEYDDSARLYRKSAESGGTVECHILEKRSDSDEESIADDEAEARFVARHLIERLRRPVYDPVTGGVKMPSYGDVAILMRSKNAAAVFSETLAYAGIPCYAQMSGGYFEAIEVQLLLNLLRVLDNRRQDIPLLSVLRSPFFDFSDQELIELRSAHKKGDLLDCLLAACEHNTHVSETLDTIDKWRRLSRRISMEELIDTVSDAVQFRERMGALPGGAQRIMNLDALTERARAFDSTGSGGVHRFLAFMDDAAQSADLGASQSVAANVVRIMTIHKSKGLEFPIVYLVGLGRQFNSTDETAQLLLHDRYGIGFDYLDEVGTRKHLFSRRLIARSVSDASWQEELRVLYVGMTRARSELYLVGCVNKAEETVNGLKPPTLYRLRKSKNALKLLMLSLSGYLPLQTHIKAELSEPEHRSALPVLPAPDPVRLEDFRRHMAWQYPFPAVSDIPIKTSVTALNARVLDPFEELLLFSDETGVTLGIRTHTVLERLPMHEITVEELGTIAESCGGIPEHYRSSIAWFVSTDLFHRMILSERVEREWSFVCPIPAKELMETEAKDSVLLQGVIDACFLEGGEWVLFDYKTDRVTTEPAEHAARHMNQIRLYCKALHSLTGIAVKEAYVVLLNAHAAVRML